VLSSTHLDTQLGYFTEDVNCRLRKTGIEENFERLFYLQGANTINMSGFNPALLTNVPCLPAPSGVVSNFIDPEDRHFVSMPGQRSLEGLEQMTVRQHMVFK
jgi:hypothetical protein